MTLNRQVIITVLLEFPVTTGPNPTDGEIERELKLLAGRSIRSMRNHRGKVKESYITVLNKGKIRRR